MELITVASSGKVMITNAAVSPGGRLFGNFPRWTEEPTPSVGEATPAGGFTPFPGGAWNEWQPDLPPHDRFVCTHGLHADRDNNLWVIDDATPHHATMVEGGAKLVMIDLETNRVSRAYALGPDLAPPGSRLSHMRVDARCLYVTDSGFGAIVVIDRETGRGHRVLEGEPCSRADPSIRPIVHGQPMVRPDGTVPVIHLSHLELSLYLSALTEDGVLKLGPARALHRVIRDERISGPNEGSIGPDGCYYFPNSQAPRVNRPYEVFKIALP